MIHTDLNPRIVVEAAQEGLHLTFYGAALENTAEIESAASEMDLAATLTTVQSPTGEVRLQLPEEDGTHLVSVGTAVTALLP